jgi:hypothetical protein
LIIGRTENFKEKTTSGGFFESGVFGFQNAHGDCMLIV